jgi:hypothetical protein
MKINVLATWLLRLVPAFILLQTLFFKFSGAEESVWIFTQVGAEPWGRIGSGIVELIAGLALLYRPTVWLGAILVLGTMSGAIASHLFILGIEVMGDGGQLFIYALLTFGCCLILTWQNRIQIPIVNQIFKS